MRTGFTLLGMLCVAACSAADVDQAGARVVAIPAVVHAPGVVPDRIILTWADDAATTQTVTWRTAPGSVEPVGEVALASDDAGFRQWAERVAAVTTPLSSDLGEALYHTVTFRDLQPGAKYVYRVGDASGDAWSEWSHFVTARREAEPFSLIYFGDAQNDIKAHWSRVVREAFREAPRAAFLVHAGDLVNEADSDAEWGEWFYSAGWILRTIPSIATPGNHEYGWGWLSDHWDPVFEFPENGPPGLRSTVYYVDYQGARIVSLDTNEDLGDQAEWLDRVLAENPQRWTLVTMHHPIYSTAKDRDNPALREILQPVFDRHRVDIVLQGHDHSYGRTGLMHSGHAHGANVPSGAGTVQEGAGGTVYVVSVSGPKMYDIDDKPFMRKMAQNTQLFQVISIEGAVLRYSAYTATGRLFDGFELHDVEGGPNELVELDPKLQ